MGAAVGSAFGVPSLGFAVGSVVGGLLFPTRQPDTFGPQMGDLSVTSSAYGADIPYGFGTMRVAGNIIWASPIQEVVNQTDQGGGGKKGGGKGGGGKGGGGGTQTTYTYWGNWAVGFAHGPAESVSRIWMDGVLVYNAIDAGGIDGSGASTYAGLNFRFYAGDEEQVADPLIEAWMALGDISPPDTQGTFETGQTPSTPAGEPPVVEPGTQAVPGHRGLCYIVFENWDLTNSGNHIPMVTAEISFGKLHNYPYVTLAPNTDPETNPAIDAGITNAGTALDLIRQVGFRASSGGEATGDYLRRFDYNTMQEDMIKPMRGTSGVERTPNGDGTVGHPGLSLSGGSISSITAGPDGFVYVWGPNDAKVSGEHSGLILKVDPTSMKEVGRVDLAPLFGLVLPGGIFKWSMIPEFNDLMVLHWYLVPGIYDGGISAIDVGPTYYMQFIPVGGSLDVDDSYAGGGHASKEPDYAPGTLPIWTFYPPHSGLFGNKSKGVLPDPTRQHPGIGFWAQGGGLPIEIYGIDPKNAQAYHYADLEPDTDIFPLADVPPQSEDGNWGWSHDPWIDVSTSSAIFSISSSSHEEFLVSWSAVTKRVSWVTNLTAQGLQTPAGDSGGTSSQQSLISDHKLAWAAGSHGRTVVQVDTVDGQVLDVQEWPLDIPSVDVSNQVWDGFYQTITSGSGAVKIFVDRHEPQQATVGDVVRYMCSLVGLNPETDLDTSDIDPILIKGYFVGQPTSPRDAILPLAQAYLFDAVESDGLIKFPLRGRGPVRTLTQEHDLAPVDQKSNLVVLETRQQELDLPLYLSVSYYDGNNNYQQGTRIRRRSAVPLQNDPSGAQNASTTLSQNIAMLHWPLVLDSQTATEAADKYLYATWQGRTSFKQTLHWGHVDLDPADVVEVILDDGTTYKQRIGKTVLGADLSVEMEGISETATIYGTGKVAQYLAVAQLARDAGATAGEIAAAGGSLPALEVVARDHGVADEDIDAAEAAAAGPSGGDDFKITAPTAPGQTFTKLILLPTPLLADLSSVPGASVLYYAASSYNSGDWPGCAVWKSSNQINWTAQDADPYKCRWGSTLDALPDNDDPFSWDDDTRLRVFLKNKATLENATDDELLDGANAMAVFNTDGNPEVIQFGTAERNADGSFTLSHLLRGRRGTDTWCHDHFAGGTVVALDSLTTRRIMLPYGDLSQDRFYKGVGAGLSIDFADLLTLNTPGNDLKPYAPRHVAATMERVAWDTDFSPDDWAYAEVAKPNDRAVHTDSSFAGTLRTTGSIVPGRWYLETTTPFVTITNDIRWGFVDGDAPTHGFIGDDVHSVTMVDIGDNGYERLRWAIDGAERRAWYRYDDYDLGDPEAGPDGRPFRFEPYRLPMRIAFWLRDASRFCAMNPGYSTFEAPAPDGYPAWDPADVWDATFGTPGDFTFSDGGRKATVVTGNKAMVGTTEHEGGRWYFELQVSDFIPADIYWGLVHSGFDPNARPGLVANSIALTIDRIWRRNNDNFGGHGTGMPAGFLHSGDWIGFAVDLDRGLIWVRNATVAPDDWYNEGTERGLMGWLGGGAPGDPVAGTNGLDFSSLGDGARIAYSSLRTNDSTVVYGHEEDQVFDPPDGGYSAGVPNGQIAVSWLRRTRINGDLHDGTGTVPLSEDLEQYQVDVMTGPGTAIVKRTVEGIEQEGFTYTAAEVLEDWDGTPEELTLQVFQMSLQVGRGFTQEVTVEVT